MYGHFVKKETHLRNKEHTSLHVNIHIYFIQCIYKTGIIT